MAGNVGAEPVAEMTVAADATGFAVDAGVAGAPVVSDVPDVAGAPVVSDVGFVFPAAFGEHPHARPTRGINNATQRWPVLPPDILGFLPCEAGAIVGGGPHRNLTVTGEQRRLCRTGCSGTLSYSHKFVRAIIRWSRRTPHAN